MLHNGHKLYNIIPKIPDPRQDVTRELLVGANASFSSGDTDMGLVYPDILGFGWSWMSKFIYLCGGGIPKTSIINRGHVQVLSDAFDPSRDAFNTLARWQYHGYLKIWSISFMKPRKLTTRP